MEMVIHRGTHQIGGTCVEVRSGGNCILLDIGLPLDSDDHIAAIESSGHTTGPALVKAGILPKLDGVYQWDPKDSAIQAILVSHSHLDHYGILRYVKPDIPVYMGHEAWGIISNAAEFLSQPLPFSGTVHSVTSGRSLQVAGFTVTPYLMDHSAFDAYAYHVTDGRTSLIYTGDFRAHGRKTKAFAFFLTDAPRNADALLIEGTMLSRKNEDVPTEKDLEQEIVNIAKSAAGMVLAYCSAQNIDRLVTFYRAAAKSGRLLVVDIYTAHILKRAAQRATIPFPGNKFRDVRVYFPWRLATRVADAGNERMLFEFTGEKIGKDEIRKKQRHIVMLVRPSVRADLEKIGLAKGSAVVYSLWAGYLKDPYVADFMKWLEAQGVKEHMVHTSGHASAKTLKRVVDTLKPKKVIPVHTERPEAYQRIAANVVIARDGQVLDL